MVKKKLKIKIKKIHINKLTLDLALSYLLFLTSSLMHVIPSTTKHPPRICHILFYFTAFPQVVPTIWNILLVSLDPFCLVNLHITSTYPSTYLGHYTHRKLPQIFLGWIRCFYCHYVHIISITVHKNYGYIELSESKSIIEEKDHICLFHRYIRMLRT